MKKVDKIQNTINVAESTRELSAEKIISKPKIDLGKVMEMIFQGYGPGGNDQTKQATNKIIKEYLNQIVSESTIFEKYNFLILYDSTTMMKSDADNIYNAVASFKENKPLLMILLSNGGEIGSAYLIGKLCREYSRGKFLISVPRQAKSAATLLCCSADEIHMGSLSELGPIDPQINRLPALGLKNSIEHIAALVKETPESAEMFAKYLYYSLKPIDIGYYERVAESAVQYATMLLDTHRENLPKKPEAIAYSLVYKFKDHGFVIDKGEAQRIFGNTIVKTDMAEYQLGNAIHKALSAVEGSLRWLKYSFYFIGSYDADPMIRKMNDA